MYEIVVGDGFVDEAPAAAVDRDQARLRAVGDGVGKYPDASVGAAEAGDRHPECVVCVVQPELPAGRDAEAGAVASAARRARGEIAGRGRQLGAAQRRIV